MANLWRTLDNMGDDYDDDNNKNYNRQPNNNRTKEYKRSKCDRIPIAPTNSTR